MFNFLTFKNAVVTRVFYIHQQYRIFLSAYYSIGNNGIADIAVIADIARLLICITLPF
jgi:hypothetical protein